MSEISDEEVEQLTHALVNQGYNFVDHPDHYGGKDNPYEYFKVAEAWGLDKDAYVFTAGKYLMRAGNKPGDSALQDYEKAIVYLKRKVKRMKEEMEK